ncbi:hypothetical protein Trydic_g12710 [Trypoxylus dichotomus]
MLKDKIINSVRLLSVSATKYEAVETGISKDRSQEIPVETSIRYLKSSAYQKTYGKEPVWVQYRRNHKGSIPPRKTRRTCFRARQLSTGNPCPVCRDEYLVLHEENVELLNQFICPHTQSILSYSKTGLCQKRHQELVVAVKRARDLGGGIAGVTCAETLAFYQPDKKIILVSESSLIKTVTNLLSLTQTLTTFNVEEASIDTLSSKYENVSVIHGKLREIRIEDKTVLISPDIKITYEYLCICIGAQPKLIPQAKNNPYVLGIRDTDSVEQFITKLSNSKRVAIIGNGGIASELVYKIQNTDIDWIIKDNHISATFVDPGAAEFFQSSLDKTFNVSEPTPSKRMRYDEDTSTKSGAALGPDWYKRFQIKGACELPPQVRIHYQTEVIGVKTDNTNPDTFPIEISLTNGEKISCDLVVSATGVEPNIDFKVFPSNLDLSPLNEIIVNEFMQTSIPNIYAAGDVCHANWEHAKHWFPMKLWTQARQMGCYVAKCMSGALNKEEILQDFCFEIFTHTTRLFGYKVILLGLYNGQKLGNDYEILFRMTKDHEYVKLILQNGKLQGAVLIGDTDLEEMCENLILNQLDLSSYKEDLLDPNIDVEDYFD